MESGQQLGRLEGTLGTFISDQKEHNKEVKAMLVAMDSRLRKTETRAAMTSAAISTAIGIAGSTFRWFVKG